MARLSPASADQAQSKAIAVWVRLFAGAAEAAGRREARLTVQAGTTIEALFDSLVRDHPRLGPMKPSLRFALNQEFVGLDQILQDGDEVAVIPPVSGG